LHLWLRDHTQLSASRGASQKHWKGWLVGSFPIRLKSNRPVVKGPIILPAKEAADARRQKTSIAAKNLLADEGDEQ
jgi:hypothetical protein